MPDDLLPVYSQANKTKDAALKSMHSDFAPVVQVALHLAVEVSNPLDDPLGAHYTYCSASKRTHCLLSLLILVQRILQNSPKMRSHSGHHSLTAILAQRGSKGCNNTSGWSALLCPPENLPGKPSNVTSLGVISTLRFKRLVR